MRASLLRLLVAAALASCGGAAPRAPSPAPSVTPNEGPVGSAQAEKLRFPPHAVGAVPDGPGWLGVELKARERSEPGVLVENVLRSSPAEVAGLAPGDVLLTVDGEPVARPQDVIRIVSAHRPGERVALVFDRNGQNRIVAVGLAARPDMNDLVATEFIGNPAPHFRELKTVQGSFPLDMASLRGRVVVLEFWASWCMVCRLEVPVLNSWHDRYGASGLTVLGVTTDPVGYATEVALDLGITYPVASDPEVTTSRAYKAMSIPMLFLIDREGTVRDVVVGYSSDRLVEVEARVRELLAAR